MAGRGRRFLESFDVHPQRTIGAQGELLAPKTQVAGRSAASQGWGFEGTAGDAKGVVEVVEGGLRMEIGPQQLHGLLAMEAVPRCQGEQLEQAPSLPQVPLLF